MSEFVDYAHPSRELYPPGFRARAWLELGRDRLLYASFYLCRYNFPIANKAISDEFGFSKTQMGWIITTVSLAYAFGQITNGLLTDKLGGKRAMLIGAIGDDRAEPRIRRSLRSWAVRAVHPRPRARRVHAELRRTGDDQDERRLVSPPRARTVCGNSSVS
jgi:hypothetical protein